MTRKGYYDDSRRLVFSAKVLSVQDLADGRTVVVLDETFFYPTSGGQPHDVGTLSQASTQVKVVDVYLDKESGEIRHLVEGNLAVGQVEGKIEAKRRTDFMVHHTGQHILSRAFIEVADAETVGFHLSQQTATIDLNIPVVLEDSLDQVESLANIIIREDRPVGVSYVSHTEALNLELRKIPKNTEDILRVITIEDFDATACGGTHTQRTGEVGILKILGVEHRGPGVRVMFNCGGRAESDYRTKHAIIKHLMAALTTGQDELMGSTSGLQEENKQLRRRLKKMQIASLEFEAKQLLEEADSRNGMRIVIRVLEASAADSIRPLATAITSHPGGVALLGVAGEKSQILFSRAEDAPGNMGELLRDTLPLLGEARGGGSSTQAQGGGPTVTRTILQQVLEDAAMRLRQ